MRRKTQMPWHFRTLLQMRPWLLTKIPTSPSCRSSLAPFYVFRAILVWSTLQRLEHSVDGRLTAVVANVRYENRVKYIEEELRKRRGLVNPDGTTGDAEKSEMEQLEESLYQIPDNLKVRDISTRVNP
eukprot:2362559-Pyramimonas_sp.AAC.1